MKRLLEYRPKINEEIADKATGGENGPVYLFILLALLLLGSLSAHVLGLL